MLLLLASAGMSFELLYDYEFNVDHDVHRLVLADDGPTFLAVGLDAVVWVDTQQLLFGVWLNRGGNDALVIENNVGAGLWLCAEDGLWWVDIPDSQSPGAPVQVVETPCDEVARSGDWLVVGGAQVVAYPTLGRGILGEPVDVLGAGAGELLMVDDTETVLFAWSEEQEVWSFTEGNLTSRLVDGAVSGLAVRGERQAWSLGSAAKVETADGTSVGVEPDPGDVYIATLNSNGLDDLVVLHPEMVGVVPADTEVEVLRGYQTLSAVIVPGETCDTFWSLSEGGVNIQHWSSSECGEICRDVGELAQGGWLPTELSVIEGSVFTLPAPPCADTLQVLWDAPIDAPMRCSVLYDGRLECQTFDDGDISITLRAWDSDRPVAALSTLIRVINVPPILDPTTYRTLSDSMPTLVARETFSENIPVFDPGDDTVTAELVRGPEGMTVEAPRRLQWRPRLNQVGVHKVVLRLLDEDGGVSEVHYRVEVDATPLGPLCCPGPALLIGVPGLLTLFRRSRARSRSRPRGHQPH